MSARKRAAAVAAVELIEPGMTVGLGTGSTAAEAITLLGARVADGLDIVGIPTSRASATQARELGIPLVELAPERVPDLTLDGADEVDAELGLIKGLGGALVREKIVEQASRRLVIMVDESKVVERLGCGPLPVEVVPFGHAATAAALANIGCRPKLRMAGDVPFVSDNGNHIYHCHFDHGIADALALDAAMTALPGVVTTGLFLGMTEAVVVAGADGVRWMRRNEGIC